MYYRSTRFSSRDVSCRGNHVDGRCCWGCTGHATDSIAKLDQRIVCTVGSIVESQNTLRSARRDRQPHNRTGTRNWRRGGNCTTCRYLLTIERRACHYRKFELAKILVELGAGCSDCHVSWIEKSPHIRPGRYGRPIDK